nr:MAG TPA: hypothetical protein [Caudoviricetes sp.]
MDTKTVFINAALERVLLLCFSLGGDQYLPAIGLSCDDD